MLPDAFNRIELGAIRREEEEQDIGGYVKRLGFMKGPIVQEQEVTRDGILGSKVIEKELETPRIQVGEFQKATRSCGGLDSTRQVIALKHLLDPADGFDPSQCQPPAGDGEQAETTFVLTEDAHRERGGSRAIGWEEFRSGSLYERGEAGLEGLTGGSVFFTWLGRATFNFAPNS